MTPKYFLTLSIIALVGMTAAVSVFAQESTATAEVIQAESVTALDLGVPNPGTLPGSPFYFLKEWRRGIQRLFIFNNVRKAELELKIVNEKAAEAKKLEERAFPNVEAIQKALENYEEAQMRLRARFESLRETSENPNVDRLLEQLTLRAVRHEKLFEELAKKFEANETVRMLAERAKEILEETAITAFRKDEPARLAARIEKALTEVKGSELKHVRSLEFIDRLESKAPEELKASFERLREDFEGRFKEDVEKFLEKENPERFQFLIKELPGDVVRRSVILEELESRLGGRFREAFGDLEDIFEDVLEREKNIVEKTKEQLEEARDKVADLRSEVAKIENVPAVVRNLLAEAENNLKRAAAAFAEGQSGEAFGQARSAEVLARNGLRLLEEQEEPDLEDLDEELREFELKINKYDELLRSRGSTRENNPKAYSLLDEASKHLGFAREAFAKKDFTGTELHLSHVRGYLNDLARLIEGEVRKPAAVVYCTEQYEPVCGADGKTYSNECFAKVAKVEIKYKGECGQGQVPSAVEPAPIAERQLEFFVAVDENGRFNPITLTVKKGSKVTWVNKNQRDIWPASAFHPTHEVYPEFDARRGIKLGESYSFIFEKIGSWKYHDHLNASKTGTVEVTE